MRTLLDRNNFSSSSNGQVAAHGVTGLWYRTSSAAAGSDVTQW